MDTPRGICSVQDQIKGFGTSRNVNHFTNTMRVPQDQNDHLKVELLAARARAAEVVTALKAQSQAAQSKDFARCDGRPDVYRQVTGTSGLEVALAEANRVVDQYDRLLTQLGATKSDTQSETVVLRRAFRVGPATIARTA